MSTIVKSVPLRVAGVLALGAAIAAALLLLRAAPAQAQSPGILAAPACQCSAPTSISGMSGGIVHCMCGVMACAVTVHPEQTAKGNLMQCIRQ